MTEEKDESIQFTSVKFDPLRALTLDGVNPPLPNIPPLDTIYKCRHFLPQTHEDYAPPPAKKATTAEKGKASTGTSAALRITANSSSSSSSSSKDKERGSVTKEGSTSHSALESTPQKESNKQSHKNTGKGYAMFSTEFSAPKCLPQTGIDSLLFKKTTSDKGPLSLLIDLFQSKVRIRVTIRHFKGVRGHCFGYLTAFDKHMNMVLLDVTEEYNRFEHKGVQIHHKDGTIQERYERVEVPRTRYSKQLFIRGDNIVMVCAAPV